VGLGIMAAAGGTRRLPALVGVAEARRLLFTAVVIGAGEALEIGLVDKVVPDADVLAAADELLRPILAQSAEAVKRTKGALLAWLHGTREDELQKLDNATQAVLFEHPDKFARMDAFLAKRAAKEKGKGT
jgi:enoyl-CoA hydratase